MKRILSFILSINLIFILVPGTVLAAPSWPSAVSIEADGGILMEAQTGTVLFAKNEDQPYYPASIRAYRQSRTVRTSPSSIPAVLLPAT